MSFSASVDGQGSNVNTPNVSGGLPMKESNSDDSVTRATLTEGKITLNKDTTPMLTTAQALGINTDINQANGEVDKPKDVNQILSEQRQISAAVGNIKSAVNTYVDRQKAPLLQEIERLSGEKKELEARQDNTGAALVGLQLKRLEDEAAEWDSGGKYRRAADALTSTIVAALTGQSVKGIAATAAAPYVNVGIKKATTDESGKVNTVANIAAHALWGAVEANALGGSGTSGALAAGVAELSAPVAAKLSKIINEVSSDESLSSTTAKMKAIVDKIKTIDKGIDSSELSNKEKEILIGITSFIGQVVAQTTSKVRGADSDTASKNGEIGSIVAKNAIANNLLGSVKFRKRLQERVKKGDKDAIRMLQIEELLKKSGVPDSEIFIDYYDKCGGCDDANKKYSIARNSSLKIITSLVKSGKLSRDNLGLIMRESSNKVLSINRGNVIGRMEAYDQANIFQHVYDFTQSTNPRKLSPLESEIKDIFNSPFGGGIEGPSSRLKPRKIKTPTDSAQAKYQSVENKGNHEWKQGTLAGENYKKIVNKVPGVVLGSYDATTGPGPVKDLDKRKSFSGARYSTIKLTEDIVAYRAWTPGQSYEFGAYWALEKPRGSLQTTIDSAIIPGMGISPK